MCGLVVVVDVCVELVTSARGRWEVVHVFVAAGGGGAGLVDLSGSLLSVMLAGERWLIGGPAVKAVH